ncbi:MULTISPECIES: transcriptional repressor [Caldimonas]|uniref:transcriptional repressor n=1 Tax=Caldimonas TaxID=196013 RepID=UPI00036F5C02|nr:transcriptional repressor [Caldimonas manganoxidans]GIX24081.1 MAG: transcriptional repressor [Caldimonas sp.]
MSPTNASTNASSARPSPAEVSRRLDRAEALCAARGAQLTALRREVLELLLLRHGSAKAYDLQDDLRQRHGRVAPTTVYRALEFLMEQQLVHRVDTLNCFVVCNLDPQPHDHPHEHTMMLVCSRCGQVTEVHDPAATEAIGRALQTDAPGFRAMDIEIKGLCAACQSAPASS